MKNFTFGNNWQDFNARYLDRERIELAKKALTDFLGDIKGKTFLDVGAGSGISSLAALQLGAKSVQSVDVDSECVRCCENLREALGDNPSWEIELGSILCDLPFGQYDIVYSWGVLHHTGDMWKALENITKYVKEDGLLYIALYNKVEDFGIFRDGRFGTSRMWQIEKKFYFSLPAFLQNCIDYAVMAILFVLYLLMLKNPFKVIRDHKLYFNKGMPWRINIKDWLGGYPYEYASADEVFNFLTARGFTLKKLYTPSGLLNNEFLFQKTKV